MYVAVAVLPAALGPFKCPSIAVMQPPGAGKTLKNRPAWKAFIRNHYLFIVGGQVSVAGGQLADRCACPLNVRSVEGQFYARKMHHSRAAEPEIT